MPRPSGSAAPNIVRVAMVAGVSVGTVSNTLNHPEKVASETQRRVREAIGLLGFVRNDLASALVAGSSKTVGLVADLGNAAVIAIARGAKRAAHESGLRLILADSSGDVAEQDAYLQLFDESRVTGTIVLATPAPHSTLSAEGMRHHGRPVVFVNPTERQAACSISVDEWQGGRLAAEQLIAHGRRRLTFISDLSADPVLQKRLNGARTVAAKAGATIEDLAVGNSGICQGRSVGKELANRANSARPDGIIVGCGLLAVGLIESLGLHHIEIPRQIEIVAFDDSRMACDLPVPLIGIEQPTHDMGRAAVALVLEEARCDRDHKHRTVILTPSISQRNSSSSGSEWESATRGRCLEEELGIERRG